MLKPKQKGALHMKWFNNPTSLEGLKKQYRQLAKAHHPDLGGNTSDMQSINTEFDKLYSELEKAEANKHSTGAAHTSNTTHTGKATTTSETAAAFRAIIEQLITLNNITIEIVGSWVWVTGDTYQHRDTLKALRFNWSRSKKAWYYHSEPYIKRSRKTFTLDEVRSLYGSTTVAKGDTALKLTIV